MEYKCYYSDGSYARAPEPDEPESARECRTHGRVSVSGNEVPRGPSCRGRPDNRASYRQG